MSVKDHNSEIPDYKSWIYGLTGDQPRLLHMMIRITDADKAIAFYAKGLGMKLLGTFEVPERRVTAYFTGYRPGSTAVELAHYWDDKGPYAHETGYSHIAIGVPDLDETLSRLESMGIEISIPPTILVEGMPRTAFVKDPDKYSVQLFQMNN